MKTRGISKVTLLGWVLVLCVAFGIGMGVLGKGMLRALRAEAAGGIPYTVRALPYDAGEQGYVPMQAFPIAGGAIAVSYGSYRMAGPSPTLEYVLVYNDDGQPIRAYVLTQTENGPALRPSNMRRSLGIGR